VSVRRTARLSWLVLRGIIHLLAVKRPVRCITGPLGSAHICRDCDMRWLIKDGAIAAWDQARPADRLCPAFAAWREVLRTPLPTAKVR
jgi:hypothetical protein